MTTAPYFLAATSALLVSLTITGNSLAHEPGVVSDASTESGDSLPAAESQRAEPVVPLGFLSEDRFADMATACAVTTHELANRKHAAAIVAWCDHRTYHASRRVTIVSAVDGTQIHDRDRPTAWKFYQRSVARGDLDPMGCTFHRLDLEATHREATGVSRRRRWSCVDLANRWPYRRPHLSVRMRDQWLRNAHDAERFGARGPHDWNANAFRYLPGCWPPKALERHDVAAYVTVKRSAMICETHGCRTKWDIKKHWRLFSPPSD